VVGEQIGRYSGSYSSKRDGLSQIVTKQGRFHMTHTYES